MSFVTTHIQARVERLVYTTTIFNHDKYACILRTLIDKLMGILEIEDRMIVMVAGNYSKHRTNQIERIFERKICMTFYSFILHRTDTLWKINKPH